MTSEDTSDENLMKNVFELRERLMQTENSLQRINKLTQIDAPNDIAVKLSFSEPYLHGASDSVNLPPPLTLDDLGELTTHDETDYSPINESVLRQWNMNNDTQAQDHHSKPSRSPSPNQSRSSHTSHRSSRSSQQNFKQNLKKQFSPCKLMGPSTSSPNLGRYKRPSSRAYSCDDLTSATDMQNLVTADSYRMLKRPSVTSHFSASAPISPRKSSSHSRYRDSSPSYSDITDRNSEAFEPMEGISSDSSISALANYALSFLPNPLKQNESANTTILENSKENITPTRPISARSNATSVTILGADAESDRLQSRLSMLREDNERMHDLVADLRKQLEKLKKEKGRSSVRTGERLKEEILSLKEESEASENALRRAEESLERSEMVCQKKIDDIISLKDEVSHLKSLLTHSEITTEGTLNNYKEAYQDAQQLAQQLEQTENKFNNFKKEKEMLNDQHQQEIQTLEKYKSEVTERAAKLQHNNTQLQADLRNALLQIDSKASKANEKDTEKMHISRALQDLQSRFGTLRSDLKKKSEDLEVANQERTTLSKKLEAFVDQNRLQQDRLSSCQREVEEYRMQITKLEGDLRKSKQENHLNALHGPVDSGRGASVTFNDRLTPRSDNDDCRCEAISPRKQKGIIAELKMKLAAKEAQIQRLEARVSNFSMESEKLEGIRGELINVVERSRMGDKRAHELEGIVHQLEDERSKVTRQLMESEDTLSDKKAECESLESRLDERTRNLTRIQYDHDEQQKQNAKLDAEMKKKSTEIINLERQLETKTQECDSRYTALHRSEEELAEKKRALDNAAEWTGKREVDSRRELEKTKKIHKEQYEEMETQIERLQSDCNKFREEARELECVVCQLRDENDIIVKRLKTTSSELKDVKNKDFAEMKKDQETLEQLERKAKESSEEVACLQSTLVQCKSEIRKYVEQLEEASSKFQHQIAVKNNQVLKLESELKITQVSLRSESLHTQVLEGNMTERQNMLEQASTRISELEECQACLQSKVAKFEQELSRVYAKSNQEREQWERKLQLACRELEAKNKQFAQLNGALKGVDKEFTSCRNELITMEQQLEKLNRDSSEKSSRLQELSTEYDETKKLLSEKIEISSNLEYQLKDSELEKQKFQEKSLLQENDLTRIRSELQALSQKSNQLQTALQTTDLDVLKKDTFIARLQSALKDTKENLSKKERAVEELERALEDRQWELQQRAAQLGQLEVSVREHKSIAEKRQIGLQSEARKAQVELKERNSQVSTLDEQLTDLRAELSEQRHQNEEIEQEVKRMNRDTEQRDERIKDLEKALGESRTAYEEKHSACLEVTQELRLAREQSQRAAQQWQDAQRDLSRLQRQQESLIGDLESLGKTDKEKEGHVSELAGKLAASRSEKAGVEERYGSELERMRNDVFKMHQQHQDEVSRLRDEHSRQLMQAKLKAGDHSDELRHALEREQEVSSESESMRDALTALERELLARKQVIEAANDTIVVKEAEIARLEAKLAGIERGKRMQEFKSPEKIRDAEDYDQPDYLPSFLAPDAKERKDANKGHKDSISPYRQHGSSTLFSGLDPDSGSLSPSFVHIAASTKKRPNLVDDTLARVLAASPGRELNANNSSEADDSLFVRVFQDQQFTENDADQQPAARRSYGVSCLREELKPHKCMADLQERLRASEQRRQEVTSKLRQLKSNAKS